MYSFDLRIVHWHDAQRPWLCEGWEFCVPAARLAVTFVLSWPNYKRSLELLKLNGHCVSPTCAKPIVSGRYFSFEAVKGMNFFYP